MLMYVPQRGDQVSVIARSNEQTVSLYPLNLSLACIEQIALGNRGTVVSVATSAAGDDRFIRVVFADGQDGYVLESCLAIMPCLKDSQ